MTRIGLAAAAALVAGSALAETAPYAGLDGREIATLSEADIADLTAGRGWGLALSAELNGYPGPAHVLEHAEALALSAEQRAQVTAVFERMQAEAQRLGRAVIGAEAELDRMFEDGVATPDDVAQWTEAAGLSLARLRAVHLAAHIEVTPLLTQHQRMIYARLRGYGAAHGGHSGHGGH